MIVYKFVPSRSYHLGGKGEGEGSVNLIPRNLFILFPELSICENYFQKDDIISSITPQKGGYVKFTLHPSD